MPNAKKSASRGAAVSGDHKVRKHSGRGNGAASTEYNIHAVTIGSHSPAATINRFANAITSENESPAATCSEQSDAMTNGDESHASTNGYRSKSIAKGSDSNATANGKHSTAMSFTKNASSVVTGSFGTAIALGESSLAICCSPGGRAMAGPNGIVSLAYTNMMGDRMLKTEHVGHTLQPYTLYRVNDKIEFVVAPFEELEEFVQKKILAAITVSA